jgi:hypothetical protein
MDRETVGDWSQGVPLAFVRDLPTYGPDALRRRGPRFIPTTPLPEEANHGAQLDKPHYRCIAPVASCVGSSALAGPFSASSRNSSGTRSASERAVVA